MSDLKKRFWSFVAYPQSLKEDWVDDLIKKGVSFAVSPLHDKDINADGTPKKPHYHIILMYGGPTTYNNVKKNITDYLGQPIPIPLESPIGMYRYFTHQDNPEKYQYNKNDIRCYNGFDISIILTNSDIKECIKKIQLFIRDNNIIEYCDLLDLLLDNELFDLWYVCSNHTILFNTYLTSLRNKQRS